MEVDATSPVGAAEAVRAGFTERVETIAVSWLDAAMLGLSARRCSAPAPVPHRSPRTFVGRPVEVEVVAVVTAAT